MANIREEALTYEAPQTRNVADLESVPCDLAIEERTFQDSEGKDFTIKVVVIDGEEYRVPNSVLAELKTHLGENPEITHFKVKKEGEGLKTKYTVIPLPPQTV